MLTWLQKKNIYEWPRRRNMSTKHAMTEHRSSQRSRASALTWHLILDDREEFITTPCEIVRLYFFIPQSFPSLKPTSVTHSIAPSDFYVHQLLLVTARGCYGDNTVTIKETVMECITWLARYQFSFGQAVLPVHRYVLVLRLNCYWAGKYFSLLQ